MPRRLGFSDASTPSVPFYASRAVTVGLLTVSLLWLAAGSILTVSQVRWNTWVNTVQAACQPGSDEKTVRLLLGKPNRVGTPGHAFMSFTPTPPRLVPRADRALLYTRMFVGKGFWVAQIYVDGNGKVIAYHIAST